LLGNRFPRKIILYGLGKSYEQLGRFDLAKKLFLKLRANIPFKKKRV